MADEPITAPASPKITTAMWLQYGLLAIRVILGLALMAVAIHLKWTEDELSRWVKFTNDLLNNAATGTLGGIGALATLDSFSKLISTHQANKTSVKVTEIKNEVVKP